MNLRDLPHGERPRERLIERGAGALSDAELLAILLRTGRAGENVLELARGIVARFRETGLSEILAMPAAEFARIPGIGTAKAATVLAALELGRRAQGAAQNRPHIREAADVYELLRPRLCSEKREHFLVLPLTSKNEVLMVADVSVGTLTNTLVHPRRRGPHRPRAQPSERRSRAERGGSSSHAPAEGGGRAARHPCDRSCDPRGRRVF